MNYRYCFLAVFSELDADLTGLRQTDNENCYAFFSLVESGFNLIME